MSASNWVDRHETRSRRRYEKFVDGKDIASLAPREAAVGAHDSHSMLGASAMFRKKTKPKTTAAATEMTLAIDRAKIDLLGETCQSHALPHKHPSG